MEKNPFNFSFNRNWKDFFHWNTKELGVNFSLKAKIHSKFFGLLWVSIGLEYKLKQFDIKLRSSKNVS